MWAVVAKKIRDDLARISSSYNSIEFHQKKMIELENFAIYVVFI